MKKERKIKARIGFNTSDGRRFEAGDDVPVAELTEKDLRALETMGAIEKQKRRSRRKGE